MGSGASSYGLWGLALINSAVFIIFAFSFAKPATRRDWRSFSTFSAFVVALFAEMYGFPLTIYLFSGWFQSRYPRVALYSHESGHLWHTLLGLKGDPHSDLFHMLSYLLIAAGFLMLSAAWRVLYAAQLERKLATMGLYAHIRHPQYVGFMAITAGFLAQWPTLLTLLMFPILVTMYIKLAHREEKEAAMFFGAEWEAYASRTPAFIPRFEVGAWRHADLREMNARIPVPMPPAEGPETSLSQRPPASSPS